MTQITRRSINLPAPQAAWLRDEAARLGINVSELVRRIIDQFREAREGK
jgi:hypothetical protein